MAVGKMSPMCEIHGENLVAGFNRCEVDGHVRLGAAVRLHVDVLATKKPFRAIDRQLLGDIDVLTASIPAFPRISFRVLVCHHAALSFHHSATCEILRGNQLDVFPLPLLFCRDCLENFRVRFAQRLAVTRR